MRKSLWIAFLVIVLCVGLGVTGFVRLNESGKQIQYEEKVLFGDKSAIDGLSVRHQLYTPIEGGYLYWDTAYRPGTGEAESVYVYTENEKKVPLFNQKFLNFGTYSNGGMQTTGSIDLREDGGEWAPILIDVAEHAGSETRYTESVNLKDYFEYFPLFFHVKLGTLYASSQTHVWDEDMEKWMSVLQDMFRIPVPEKSYFTVEMHKRTDGSVYHYSISSEGSIPYFYSQSLITDKYCYLLVGVRVSDDMYADSSLGTELEKEYQGIYRIPYETGSDEKTVLRLEEMEKIASLEHEMMRYFGVRYDEKWDRIELIYEGDKGVESPELMVFDAKTGETVQTLTLPKTGDYFVSSRNIYYHDDFMVIGVNEFEGEKGEFTLLGRTEDGSYHVEFKRDWTNDGTWFNLNSASGVDFDGERLVMGGVVKNKYVDGEKGLFEIVIYEAGELIFHGQYQSSLVIGEDINNGWQHLKGSPTVSWD